MTTVTKQYDSMFEAWTLKWLPQWPWLYLKAQGYAESLLQPDAVSPAGAKGIMQFVDDTWADTKYRLRTILPATATPFQPEWAIPAGVYYMSLMRNGWAAPRPEEDRRNLAFASYNSGFGNILKAQQAAGGVNDYESIVAKLSEITGVANAKQTTDYVKRINQYYQQFLNETRT